MPILENNEFVSQLHPMSEDSSLNNNVNERPSNDISENNEHETEVAPIIRHSSRISKPPSWTKDYCCPTIPSDQSTLEQSHSFTGITCPKFYVTDSLSYSYLIPSYHMLILLLSP